MKGRKVCEHCEVEFSMSKSDIQKKEKIEEDLDFLKSIDDYKFVEKGFFLFKTCTTVSGKHFDLNKVKITYVVCPFCGEDNNLTEEKELIRSRREETRREIW